jgi:hypothetical protein
MALNYYWKNAVTNSGALKIRTIMQSTIIKRLKENLLNSACSAIPNVEGRLPTDLPREKEDITGMNSDEQSNEAIPKCDLCERKMNPTVKIYNDNTFLCSACFYHIKNMPEIVAKSVERFLIGNVV